MFTLNRFSWNDTTSTWDMEVIGFYMTYEDAIEVKAEYTSNKATRYVIVPC